MRDDERQVLDRDQLVRVALRQLDEEGLEGLSMRRLAQRLGVTAASLYWHVRDKEELLSLLADAICEEIPLPDPGRPWRAELEALAWRSRGVLLEHRHGGRVLLAGSTPGPARLQLEERTLEVLRAAGFDTGRAAMASHLLTTVVTGFAIDEESHHPAEAEGAGASELPPEGCLVVRSGASNVTVGADPELADLYRLQFAGRSPEVELEGGTLAVRGHGRRGGGEVVLNAGIPWRVVIEGGASALSADLEGLRLLGLEIAGGVHESTFRLGRPSGEVLVRVEGGANKLVLQRPAGVPVRVVIGRGASRLVLDDLQLGSVGGETRWESTGYASAEDRYHIEVGGGASRLTIAELPAQPPATPAPAAAPSAPADRDALFRFAVATLLSGLSQQLA